MKMIRFGWINGLIGSFLISLCCPCCFLQVVLNLFGVGCAGLNTFLLPYRPVFIALTVISLTYSYIRYRPSKSYFLTIVSLTLFLSFSPELLQIYNNNKNSNKEFSTNTPFDRDVIITHWQITGMHCESCRSAIIRSLEKLNDIISINVDLDTGQADLITRKLIDDEKILQTIQSAGFQAYKII